MRAQKKITLGLIFLLVIITSFSFIAAEPPMPSAFYGDFTHSNETFPNGHFLIAKINGVVSGECPIVDQKFGDSGSCVVLSYEDNVPIEFYLGDTKIGESTFNNMERVNLNFTVDFIPELVNVPSNGICEAELDECSYNILDCNIIVSDVCVGNGICEPHLGETCQNSPQDCGECPSTEEPSSGETSSSSSGGGGGGGTSSPSTTYSNNSSEENETESFELETSSQDLDEQEDTSVDEKPRRGISGWSIFGGNDSNENQFKSWIWITIILLILFFYLIKKSRKEKKKKFDKKLKESLKKYDSKTKKRKIKKAPPRRK